jgi:hypothetical protein
MADAIERRRIADKLKNYFSVDYGVVFLRLRWFFAFRLFRRPGQAFLDRAGIKDSWPAPNDLTKESDFIGLFKGSGVAQNHARPFLIQRCATTFHSIWFRTKPVVMKCQDHQSFPPLLPEQQIVFAHFKSRQ